jgi:nucleotide-binding universal stress UspA family protein
MALRAETLHQSHEQAGPGVVVHQSHEQAGPGVVVHQSHEQAGPGVVVHQSHEQAGPGVVLVIDDDPATRHGLVTAASLARYFGASLQVVAVLPPNSSGARYSALRVAVDDSSQWLADRFDGVRFDTAVVPGDREVCPICMAYPGVVVVGSARLWGAKPVVLPRDLMRHATHASIVVVGPTAAGEWRPGPIAVALDGSTLAESVLPLAASWARAIGVPLEIVQVVPPSSSRGHVPCTEYLRSIRRTLAPDRIDANCHTIAAEDVAAAVAEHATSRRCSLLALATHGTKTGRDGLGTVASRVIALSRCPVLVSRPFASSRILEFK